MTQPDTIVDRINHAMRLITIKIFCNYLAPAFGGLEKNKKKHNFVH
jgi:hypothetical protein